MRFILCCADTEVNIKKKSILVINILANGSYFSANITMSLNRGYHNRHYNSKISLRQTLISRNSDILFVLLLYKKEEKHTYNYGN